LFYRLSLTRAHTGFDKLMPEGQHASWKYLPFPGARLSVAFGTPVPPAMVRGALGTVMRGGIVPMAAEQQQQCKDREVRIALTDVVQCAVEALGRQVSGDLLVDRLGLQPTLPPPRKRI